MCCPAPWPAPTKIPGREAGPLVPVALSGWDAMRSQRLTEPTIRNSGGQSTSPMSRSEARDLCVLWPRVALTRYHRGVMATQKFMLSDFPWDPRYRVSSLDDVLTPALLVY